MHFFPVFSLLSSLASVTPASQFTFDDYRFQNPVISNRTCSLSDDGNLVTAAQSLQQDVCLPDLTRHTTAMEPAASPHSDPWTQKSSCIKTFNESHLFCVYTSSTFARGRGISVFTTPSVAKQLAQNAAFANPEVLEGINVESNPPYVAHALPMRGIGLIANRTLQRGDNIFSHTPIFIVNRATFDLFMEDDRLPFQIDAVNRLPARSRELFLAPHGHFGGDKVDDIIHTNSFQINLGEDDEPHNVIFPETSRINHDCRPNAHYYFDANTLTHHVHAIRTIYAGEELSISYTDGSVSRAERKAAIKQSWGFDCSCSLCTQRDIFAQESDKRLKLIEDFEAQLDDWSRESRASPEMAETLISLYEQERLHAPIAEAYTHAALAYNAVGKEQPALKYAALAIEFGTLNSGPEFEDVLVMRELMEDPKGHWSWLLRQNVLR